jgi:hypothetical protein
MYILEVVNCSFIAFQDWGVSVILPGLTYPGIQSEHPLHNLVAKKRASRDGVSQTGREPRISPQVHNKGNA